MIELAVFFLNRHVIVYSWLAKYLGFSVYALYISLDCVLCVLIYDVYYCINRHAIMYSWLAKYLGFSVYAFSTAMPSCTCTVG